MKKPKRSPRAAAPEPTALPPVDAPVPAAPPPAPSRGSSTERWIDRAIVVCAVLAAFGRTLAYPLLASWDDGRFLIDDPLVSEPSVESFRAIWSEPHFQAYHPLHLLSYWIDVPWLGAVGWAVRSTNLVLFVGVGLLLLALLRELGLPRWPALVATLAFALHPVQVELVVWGTGRKDVLADLLALGAWLLHLRSARWLDRAAWGSRVLFLLACLAKTSAVPLPLAMAAVDVLLRRRSPRDAGLAQLPSIAIAAALGALTIAIWSSNDMIRPLARGGSSLVLVLTSLSHAVTTAFWPAETSPLYALVDDDPPGGAMIVLGVVVVGCAAALAYASRTETWSRWLAAGVAAFVLLFLPVANVLPTYFHFQDRHLSLPFVGLAIAIAALATVVDRNATATRPSPTLALLAVLALAPLAARTIQYEAVWSSDVRLWSHATSTHPRSFFAWMKLGEVLRDRQRFDGAIEAYANAVQIQPTSRLAYAGLLMTMVLRDERDEHLEPSRVDEIVDRYGMHADQAELLRRDAFEMVAQGYRMAALFVLSRSLDLEPVSDERLERAAQLQLLQNQEWLARFYVGRMTRRPIIPGVARFFDEQRRALGLGPDPEETEEPEAPAPEAVDPAAPPVAVP